MMKHVTWHKKMAALPKQGEPGSKRKKPLAPIRERRLKRKLQRIARKITQAAKRKK